MKKSILVLGACFMLLATQQSYAQAEFALGIKAGPNFAKINADESPGENLKGRTGIHAGAFMLIKLTKIGIQPEIIFSQQGSKATYSGSPDIESNFSYMNIPIIIKLYTIAGINLQAGPQFGFLTSAKIKVDGADEQDVKDQLKGSDISVALGAGWDLPFGLTIDARYNLGLSKIDDSGAGSSGKNQVFQVSLGYKLIKFGK